MIRTGLKRMALSLFFLCLLAGIYFSLECSTTLSKNIRKDGQQGSRTYFEAVPIPDTLSFAGEPVPLKFMDVRESLDRELLVNSYFHSQTLRFLKMAPRFFNLIEPILKKDSIPDDFKYLALAESGFDPLAVSPVGAVGMWQLMKGTARDYGLEVDNEVDERYSIAQSTQAACDYLKESYQKFKSWTLVAASYNAGRNFMTKQIALQKQGNYYNLLLGEETGRYLFRILALKLVMEHPRRYGFIVREKEKYPLWKTKSIKIDTPVIDFADFALNHGTNYKILKMLNPWLRKAYLTNASGRAYQIILPQKGFRTNRR